ncbi:MAG TPA: hypothetical protein VGM80_14180 [Gaiellaceae bacterium]
MTIAEARIWLAERLTAECERARDPDVVESEASGEEERGHGLRKVFAERSISLGTMERNLRFAVAGAMLVLVAAAVLVGLRDVAFDSIEVGSGPDAQAVIPAVVFWLSIAFLTLAWSTFLWGLLHAHRLVRLAGLALFSWAMFELWHDVLTLAVWRMAPSYALLACIWVIGLAAMRIRAKERWQEEIQVLFFPLLLVLVGGLYLAFWWRLRPLHDPHVYTLFVFHQLQQLSFALIPLLYVAGVDFAEWGDAAATRIGETLGGVRAPYALAAVTFGLACFALVYRVDTLGGRTFALQLGFGFLFAALVTVPALAAGRSGASARVPYAAVFAAASILLVLVVGGSDVLLSAPGANRGKATLSHAGVPRFQLEYPASWGERAVPGQSGLKLFLLAPRESVTRMYVFYIPSSVASSVPDPLNVLFKPEVHSRGTDGPWALTRFTGNGMTGVAWQRRDRGAIWLLAGLAKPAQAAALGASFAAIARSWTTEVAPGETEAQALSAETVRGERVLEIAALAWLGVAAVAAFVLLRRRRRNPGWLSAAALFFVSTGVLYFLIDLPNVAHRMGFTRLTAHLRFPGVQMAAAVATLAAVAVLAVRRRLSVEPLALLLVLNGGLLAVQWLDRAIVSGEDAAGRFSIVQAVLIMVAFGWDILVSGEAITNRHTRHVPRQTRVLVYLGYVMLVATAVLFFSSLHVLSHGKVSEPGFESEAYPDSGLLVFGTALLVTLFALRLGKIGRERPDAPAAAAGEALPETG